MFKKAFLYLSFFFVIFCTHTKPMVINYDNIKPGSTVKVRGKMLKLHKGSLATGDNFLTFLKGTDISIPFQNKVTVINIVPSIDTKVCEEQTHILGETTSLNPNIDRMLISRDLPMAQQRFAEAAKLGNLSYVSDYKTATFGKKSGLLIQESTLLARGVVVLDAKGTVRYMQFVSELSQLPDMKSAFDFANSLSK